MSDAQESQNTSASSSSVPAHVSSANLLPFLDISPDALVIVNQAGAIVMVNGQTEAVFGYSREELQGSSSNCSSLNTSIRSILPIEITISPTRELVPWGLGFNSSGSVRMARNFQWRSASAPYKPGRAR